MNGTAEPRTLEWSGARGDRWRAQLGRLEAMFRPVDGPLIEALAIASESPQRIADLACGGGGTTLRIHASAPAGSDVVGIDLNAGLIAAARARVPVGARGPTFRCADVASAPPPHPAYHRLASRFGVMFFDDAPAAFANLARWLTPGGRFAFAVWGQPAENPWMTSMREVVAAHVALPSSMPDAPGPFRYGDADALPTLLQSTGLRVLEMRTWTGEFAIGGGLGPVDAADFALGTFSFAAPLLDAPEAVRARVREALAERLARHQTQGEVRLDACVRIVSGTRGPS